MVTINFTNKWLYSFIAVGVLILLGVGVYAFGGVQPNIMGHSTNEIAPPTGCGMGQVLTWGGDSWDCVDMASGDGSISDSFKIVYEDGGDSALCMAGCPASHPNVIAGGCQITSSNEKHLKISKPNIDYNGWLCHWHTAGWVNCWATCTNLDVTLVEEVESVDSEPLEIILNKGVESSLINCDSVCGQIGLQCLTVGTDEQALNEKLYKYYGGNLLSTLSASCSTIMEYSSTYDSIIGDVDTYTLTNCKCVKQS